MHVKGATAAVMLLALACGRGGEAPPPALPDLDSRDLARAALSADDAGSGWNEETGAPPNTIQIGGEVGAANVTNPVADATTTFEEDEGPGVLSNSVFMVASESVARAVVQAHRDAARKATWVQEREDGGVATFESVGAVEGLGRIGDEAFTASLEVTITSGRTDEPTRRLVEYVLFRNGPILSFVVAQDAGAEPFVQVHAQKIRDALADAAPRPS